MSAETIAVIWAFIIATAVFLYVCMDGFDLGLGILFPWIDGRDERDLAVNTVAPVWDGNETWLIMGGGGLFAVFPLAYATILPALYMPLILMLLALIFRGVVLRDALPRPRRRGSSCGGTAPSRAAASSPRSSQGIALGALVQGVRVEDRAYAGGWWDWLSPFSVLTGRGAAGRATGCSARAGWCGRRKAGCRSRRGGWRGVFAPADARLHRAGER